MHARVWLNVENWQENSVTLTYQSFRQHFPISSPPLSAVSLLPSPSVLHTKHTLHYINTFNVQSNFLSFTNVIYQLTNRLITTTINWLIYLLVDGKKLSENCLGHPCCLKTLHNDPLKILAKVTDWLTCTNSDKVVNCLYCFQITPTYVMVSK